MKKSRKISLGRAFGFLSEVASSKLFSQICMHVQLFSHRDSRGCRAVCTRPSDHSTFLLLQQKKVQAAVFVANKECFFVCFFVLFF